MTLGDGNHVDDLVLLEHRLDVEGLLKVLLGEVDLLGDGTTVNLHLHKVRLLLLEAGLAHLSVGEHTHNGAVLSDALELARDRGAVVLRVLLA